MALTAVLCGAWRLYRYIRAGFAIEAPGQFPCPHFGGVLKSAPEPGRSRSFLLAQFEPEFDLCCRLPWASTVDSGPISPLFHSSDRSGHQFLWTSDLADVAHASIHTYGDLQNYNSLDASNLGFRWIGCRDLMYELFNGFLGFKPDLDRNDRHCRSRTCIH